MRLRCYPFPWHPSEAILSNGAKVGGVRFKLFWFGCSDPLGRVITLFPSRLKLTRLFASRFAPPLDCPLRCAKTKTPSLVSNEV